MADNRLELDAILRGIIGNNLYFQPPETLKMNYPCIRYELSDVDSFYADNRLYRFKKAYDVTVIDPNPDSNIPNEIIMLPLCTFHRFYVADNLNHFVFKLYY